MLDNFTASYNSDGEALWVKGSGGEQNDESLGISLDNFQMFILQVIMHLKLISTLFLFQVLIHLKFLLQVIHQKEKFVG